MDRTHALAGIDDVGCAKVMPAAGHARLPTGCSFPVDGGHPSMG